MSEWRWVIYESGGGLYMRVEVGYICEWRWVI